MATETKGKKGSVKSGGTAKKESAKQRAQKKRRKIFIFAAEIVVLLAALVVLWGVLKGTESGRVEIREDKLFISNTVAENETLKGYRNIALFGVDSTVGDLTKNTRTDTIIIASINQDTGEVKLVSLYRDTYLNLSNDTYTKCNAAYAKGGPEMAINMLNMNLDMNITDFVTVGFAGLSDTIDALGGIVLDVDDVELLHINNYQYCMAEDLKRSYKEVTTTGTQLLDGLQATAYCRIRYGGGDDFKRTERQREVLLATSEVAKTASITSLTSIANNVFNEVYTSLDLSEIIELLGGITKYQVVADEGFPRENLRSGGIMGSSGDSIVPTSLEDNVKWLHEFLFDDSDYQVSSDVQRCSEQIYNDAVKANVIKPTE